MELTDIDLQGLGHFGQTPASFTCTRFHLPAPWDYVYTNGKVLLRIRHDGAGYVQVDAPHGPPLLGGPPLLYQENGHVPPSAFTWIVDHNSGGPRAFSNFYLPMLPLPMPVGEPESYECDFRPERALYRLTHQSWGVETEIFVPPNDPAVVTTVTITNHATRLRSCTVMPVLRPYLSSILRAPWDLPEWYQTSAFCGLGGRAGFWFQMRDPGGNPAHRMHAGLLTDLRPQSFEVAYSRFVGAGQWHAPQTVERGVLALPAGAKYPAYGQVTAQNAAVGQPPLAALSRRISLCAGASFRFTTVLFKLPDRADGRLPAVAHLSRYSKYLGASKRRQSLAAVNRQYQSLFAQRRIDLPDRALSRYVNELLPLQAHCVMDRGWPGFRGVRDSAQDATAIIPLNLRLARERLVEAISFQRSDGWYPRGYNPGKPDTLFAATHVDGGVWVWEFLWEYLCFSRDFAVLDAPARWLDRGEPATVLRHVLKAFEYYLHPENLGVHGLCKIRGGDWNDSVNLAGVEGRGETVMVSCQLVLALEQAAELLAYLGKHAGDWLHLAESSERNGACPPLLAQQSLGPAAARLQRAAARMRKNLLRHALNREGYFNAVWNDARRWVFSPRDPDGQKRVNGPANAFAVIAGIVQGDARRRVFEAFDFLKGPDGWNLFYPAIGHPPIAHLGRIGQGDLAAGLGENGAPYNHGSHGFLARAAAVAGQGDLLYEVLRAMLPYDQQVHPVARTRSAPYGIVNCWKEAIGLEGVGGDVFFSGSIPTAIRNCYEGLAGFRPGLEHLVIDPCVAKKWASLSYEAGFLGGRFHVRVGNPGRVECGVKELRLNGEVIANRHPCPRTGRSLAAIPLSRLRKGKRHDIHVVMG